MLIVFSDKASPRLDYVCDWIFTQWGIKYTKTSSVEDFKNKIGVKIWYSSNAPSDENAYIIIPHGLLENDSLPELSIDVQWESGLPFLFVNKGDAGFDIFSAIFFMVSRYEEYLPFEPDIHGRFPASSSLAYKLSFLELPVVDRWIQQFKGQLQAKFPELILDKGCFQVMPTYDIDVAFKFKGRSWIHTFSAAIRDLFYFKLTSVSERINVVIGKKKDPWDVYKELNKGLSEKELPAVFFILTGDASKYDNNLPLNDQMKNLLNDIKEWAEVGVHPSYYSSVDSEKISEEITRLEKSMKRKVLNSRQHFLKFKLPSTFLALESAGIKNDYSMAFPDAPGFRAGTSKPFYFYDLKHERTTSLRLFPSCFMDSTFVHYLDVNPGEALKKARLLLQEVKNVNGCFIPIFHNDYLADPEWKKVHDSLLNEANAQFDTTLKHGES